MLDLSCGDGHLDFQWTKIENFARGHPMIIHLYSLNSIKSLHSFWEKLQYLKIGSFNISSWKVSWYTAFTETWNDLNGLWYKKNRTLNFHGNACIYVYQVVSEIQLALKHSIVCLMKMINPKQLAFYVGKFG